ncbi:DUF4192 domain-containing protein [Kitasatospora sp. NPDC050543]|uniref:DUF4192 domain-containing protein n=1 Tax=Kitasatospora sp. NPDC050543 TaxID=3364054 RepID=UPI003796DDEA
MNDERDISQPGGPIPGHPPVRMRGPGDMAEALPYLMGFFPDDSIVAVGLQGTDLHQGGVIRIDIPENPATWRRVATETARLLLRLSEQRDRRPAQVLLYLCRDPREGGGPQVLDGLRPLADALRAAFEGRGVKVKESLCISDGRWRSFLCRGADCCAPTGNPIRSVAGPGPVAVAATVAGLAPRGSRRAIIAGLAPIGPPGADSQRRAIARAAARHRPGGGGPALTPERAAGLLERAMAEFAAGARELDEQRAALLLLALQDKRTRDRAAEYAEPAELGPAQRLWRFLARRCVPPFESCAPAPLTLLAWVSWLAGDSATARVVLARALDLDPHYLLAQLLYESLNGGLAPDLLLASVRAERAGRAARTSPGPSHRSERPPSASSATSTPAEPPAPADPVGNPPGDAPARSRPPGNDEADCGAAGVAAPDPQGPPEPGQPAARSEDDRRPPPRRRTRLRRRVRRAGGARAAALTPEQTIGS